MRLDAMATLHRARGVRGVHEVRAFRRDAAPPEIANRQALRLGLWASLAIVVAAPLSGPLGLLIVGALAPQPVWQGPALFIAAYHPIQTFPFAFGFLLVAAFVALHAAILATAPRPARAGALLSFAFATVFASVISLNYVAQTAIVPTAVHRNDITGAITITLLTMANPSSVGWALEMFGYGFLGLASLCAAPAFRQTRADRVVSALLVANAITSVAGAVATAVRAQWVLTAVGLWSYLGWNVLVVAMALTLARSFRARLQPVREHKEPT